jgi:hypothetical protein
MTLEQLNSLSPSAGVLNIRRFRSKTQSFVPRDSGQGCSVNYSPKMFSAPGRKTASTDIGSNLGFGPDCLLHLFRFFRIRTITRGHASGLSSYHSSLSHQYTLRVSPPDEEQVGGYGSKTIFGLIF